jgi:hypothetical protein
MLKNKLFIIIIFLTAVILLIFISYCQPNPFLSGEGLDIWKSSLWKEIGRLNCSTGEFDETGSDLIQVRFLYNGEFEAYYGSMNMDKDLSGTYYFNMEENSFSIEIDYRGGDYPDSTFIDRIGSFEVLDNGNIILDNFFFGANSQGCGHLLKIISTEYN